MKTFNSELWAEQHGEDCMCHRVLITPLEFLRLIGRTAYEISELRRAIGFFIPDLVPTWTENPYLEVDWRSAAVTGFEGQHRMAAMVNSGIFETEIGVYVVDVELVRAGDIDALLELTPDVAPLPPRPWRVLQPGC